MLHVEKNSTTRMARGGLLGDSAALELVTFVVGLVRRHLPMFVTLTAVCVTLGLIYIFTTAPQYTAVAQMVLDVKKVQLFQQQGSAPDAPEDAATVQTQVELLKSQNVSMSVIKQLNLTDDPEFVSPKAGIVGSIFGFFTGFFAGNAPPSDEYLQRRALSVLDANRTVARLGQTYVMEVGYRSLDPEKAARVANTIVDAYVNDQIEAKYQSTRRASVWLQERIKELRGQATVADQAMVKFRNENNIVAGEHGLLNEQQVGEVNTQLVTAQAATAEAKARLDRIKEVMKQPIPDPSVTDALHNEIIVKLRSSYLELAGKEAIWAVKYGPNHMATVSLRNQMLELRHNITDEMRKIALSYESDYEIALAREGSLKSSLAKSVDTSHTTSQAEIQLRSLQSTSASYRSMYDILLQRYMETVQQQSFPISEARLISPALRPGGPSQPNKIAVLASTITAALMLSFGAAFAKELLDRVFRTGKQVEEQLHINCVATLPTIRAETVPLLSSEATNKAAVFPKLGITNPIFRYVVGMPFSQFTEALRSVKVAIDIGQNGRRAKVIGITSTLPGEGKTTIAANLGHLIAHSGGRVLLVDGDLRNPSLTRAFAPQSTTGGLVDVIAGQRTFREVLWTDESSGLQLLTVGGSAKLMHTNEILGSEKTSLLFQHLQTLYDYIIVDCAPLAPVVDTRTTINFIDSYLYVIQWGQTKTDVIQQTMQEAPEIYDRVLGVVLTKADMSVLGRYELHRSNHYYKKYYAKYGYAE